MKRTVVSCILFVVVSIITYSQNSNVVNTINDRMKLQSQIERGNMDALNMLGVSYLQKAPKDYQKAFDLFQRAYKSGVDNATFNLGHCYFHGYGVPKDYRMALKLFLEDGGKTCGSLFYIGVIYFHGYGVNADYDKAFDYLQKAKACGQTNADEFIALCYAEGKGVDKDEERALSILLPLANKNDVNAQFGVANIYRNQGNNERALYWYGKIATQFSTASVLMGDIYKSENNIDLAKQYYRKASDYGVAIGEYKLGEIIYDEAMKLERNGWKSDAEKLYSEAFHLFKDASEDSFTPVPGAMRLLQACYRYGRGTEQNAELADKWKNEALKHKDLQTIELLKIEINNK